MNSAPADLAAANRALCAAAAAGDTAEVRRLLGQGAPASGYFDPVAARQREEESMRRLEACAPAVDLFAGLPQELRDELEASSRDLRQHMAEECASAPWSREIPLFCAAESGSAECVRLLLADGAALDARDNFGATALHHAASVDAIKALLEAGLSIEVLDRHDLTPLAAAVREGRSALPRIEALLACGANPNATCDRGFTVLMGAAGAMERDRQVLDLLIQAGADPHAVSELGHNAVHAAIDVDSGEGEAGVALRGVLECLRERGVNLEQRTVGGQTPLARAIAQGTAAEVQLLCDLGADPNAVCPMHECGEEACEAVERPLLFHAADGHGVHGPRKTAILLSAGADPLATDVDGYTALEHVVSRLCAEGAAGDSEHTARYESIFDGLSELPDPLSRRMEQGAFVAEATPIVRALVERRAQDIPFVPTCGLDEGRRAEQIETIVLLMVAQAWARRDAPG